MGYEEEYRRKLKTAEEAVKVIQSGDWVDYGWCATTPETLDRALAGRTDELFDVKLRGGILFHLPAVFEREDAGEHFCWNSWHMSGVERKLIDRGCAYYAPLRYSELPVYYVQGGDDAGGTDGCPWVFQLRTLCIPFDGSLRKGRAHHCGSQSKYAPLSRRV